MLDIIDQLKNEKYNKYLLYFIIENYCRWEYHSMESFCNDFCIVYREIEKTDFTPFEKNFFDQLDTKLQLYSPYENDREQYQYYLSEQEIDTYVKNLLNQHFKWS